ncbi:energy transducer TonB [Spirosoma sp.]|uniref:energy transducer TonB n=1 Tax=Spirosoma sp. TaxID=1899569 RepID=UPI003B3ADDBF
MSNSLLSLLLLSALCSPIQIQNYSPAKPDQSLVTNADEPPQFPGGMDKLADYLKKNLQYPKAARKAKLEGRIVVNFVVTSEGRIEDVKLYNSLGLGTDEEAIRLVENMPIWIPAKQGGKAVNARYNLPIDFSLK